MAPWLPTIGALTDWVLAHKRRVAGFWAVATVLGVIAFPIVASSFSDDADAPRGGAAATNQRLEHRFGSGTDDPLVAVVELPSDTTARTTMVRRDLRRLEARLVDALPGTRIASYASTRDPGFVSRDGRTTFALVFPPSREDPELGAPDTSAQIAAARRVAARTRVGGSTVTLTARDMLRTASAGAGADSTVLIETLVAGLAALAVLVFVFASPLALLTLVVAAVAIPSTFLAVLGLMAFADVSFIVLFLVALVGLGIAIDYALIVVTRWREERDRGASNERAVQIACATAGRAVVFSGTTVAIGLLAAVTLPVPFLRSIGYGGLLIPLVSVAVTLTLLPVLLATWGPAADRHRLRQTERAELHWASLARLVVRRRWAALLAGSAVLATLCIAAGGLLLGEPEARSLTGSGPAREALEQLERSGIGAGPLAPIPVLADTRAAGPTAAALADVAGVRAAVAPRRPGWRQHGEALALVIPAVDTFSHDGRDVLAAVRERAATLDAAAIGGWAAEDVDFVADLYRSFPVMVALMSLITFLLLARAFRSILLPLKAIVLNLVSVFAAWGLIAIVWQQGLGTELLFGEPPAGAVASWVPLIVFAFLYGLSMDYEVFILARMREEYDRTGSTDAAVVGGIARTGRLVTSAALIVFFAFAMMGAAGDTDVKMLATGLAGGILLDALIVRTLLVPALVSLFGRWNWWLPEPARRVLLLPASAAAVRRSS